MLDELLEKKLKNLTDKDILVVMDDGLAFLGRLQEFDKNTLVLKKVYQALAEDIDWKQIPSESSTVREGVEEERKVGFLDWTQINLEEVYLRVDHVSRIWRWFEEEQEEKTQGETRQPRRPVYTKREELPDERASSIGDIQDTFPG